MWAENFINPGRGFREVAGFCMALASYISTPINHLLCQQDAPSYIWESFLISM
jgi:hypothetical protein